MSDEPELYLRDKFCPSCNKKVDFEYCGSTLPFRGQDVPIYNCQACKSGLGINEILKKQDELKRKDELKKKIDEEFKKPDK